MSPAHSQVRRNIIRTTWQKYYNHPAFEKRFVICNPGDLWLPIIQQENETYHDLIMMPHLEENAHVANTVKTLEFLRWLVRSGTTYKFVSKVDDDSFLDASTFYREFLEPLLAEGANNRTIIGRKVTPMDTTNKPYSYAGGQFYTLTWEMVLVLARLFEQNPIGNVDEDLLIGRLLHEANEYYFLKRLTNPRAFDYLVGQTNIAKRMHDISPESINVHKMKDDETYLAVAAQMYALHPE